MNIKSCCICFFVFFIIGKWELPVHLRLTSLLMTAGNLLVYKLRQMELLQLLLCCGVAFRCEVLCQTSYTEISFCKQLISNEHYLSFFPLCTEAIYEKVQTRVFNISKQVSWIPWIKYISREKHYMLSVYVTTKFLHHFCLPVIQLYYRIIICKIQNDV